MAMAPMLEAITTSSAAPTRSVPRPRRMLVPRPGVGSGIGATLGITG